MTVCVRIKGKRQELCSGDLDRFITIQDRKIVPPIDIDDVDYTEEFEDDGEEACMVETINGQEVFDGTNVLIGVIDTRFYIRFRDDINAQSWILFEDERYNIIKTIDLDKRHLWLRLDCDSRGTVVKVVNEA